MQKKVMTVMAVMVLSATTQNIVSESRKSGDYEVIEYAECERKKDADAPIGVVQEWRFVPDKVTDSDTLAFYINHYNIEVYLGEESVYQMKASDGVIRTPGSVWVMVPLRAEDTGKEVRIELSPLYENYQEEVPEIMLGSELAIYKDVLWEALPELILQPVVENAIKHGVSKKMGNGTIILRTRDMRDSIVITVEDDGVGFAMEELEQAGVGYLVKTSENRRYLKVDEVDCDLYRILAGDKQAKRLYCGEYLREYGWAEELNAQLHFMLLKAYQGM